MSCFLVDWPGYRRVLLVVDALRQMSGIMQRLLRWMVNSSITDVGLIWAVNFQVLNFRAPSIKSIT